MEYGNLGRSGLTVSRLCLGCMSYGDANSSHQKWALSEEDSRPFFRQALEAGINFFDTANSYSDGRSEEITGRALRDFARREELVIATKAFFPWRATPNTGGLSRKALFQAVDDSLRRLGTDYIDLYQIHRWDVHTPIEETLEALHDIVKSGRVRYLGASSMSAWQFMKALALQDRHGWARFIAMQPQLNLIYREEEREMLPLCIDQGVGVIPWSPLARGGLTRDPAERTNRSEKDKASRFVYASTEDLDRPVIETVASIAAERGVSRAVVAMAWLYGKAGVTAPIVGATKPHHLADALAALAVRLSDEEVARLEAPYVPHPVVGIEVPRPRAETLSVL